MVWLLLAGSRGKVVQKFNRRDLKDIKVYMCLIWLKSLSNIRSSSHHDIFQVDSQGSQWRTRPPVSEVISRSGGYGHHEAHQR